MKNIIKFTQPFIALTIVVMSVLQLEAKATGIHLGAVNISNITINGMNIEDTNINAVRLSARCLGTGRASKKSALLDPISCKFNSKNSTPGIWDQGSTIFVVSVPQIVLNYKNAQNVCLEVLFLKNAIAGKQDSGETVMTAVFCSSIRWPIVSKSYGQYPISEYANIMKNGVFIIPKHRLD